MKTLRTVTDSALFNNFVLTVIFCNTASLSIDFYGIERDEHAQLRAGLRIADSVFTWVFIAEMVHPCEERV